MKGKERERERESFFCCNMSVLLSSSFSVLYASFLSTKSGRQWEGALSFFLAFTLLRRWRAVVAPHPSYVGGLFIGFFVFF